MKDVNAQETSSRMPHARPIKVKFNHGAFKKGYKEGGKFEAVIPALGDIFKNFILAFVEGEKYAGEARKNGTIHGTHRNFHESAPKGIRKSAIGWFNGTDGSIHINLGNCRNVEQADAVVLHEAVGHLGLRRLVGEKAMRPSRRRYRPTARS